MKIEKSKVLLVTVVLAFAIIISPTMAEECSSSNVTSVSTDKMDYAPGETVIISGEGFVCGSELILNITLPNGSVDSSAVTINNSGAFTYRYQLDGISGKYTVEVLDADGNVLANTIFYDSHFRFGHLTWTKVGPNKAQFESVVGFRNWNSYSVGDTVTPTRIYFGDGSSINPTYTVIFASGPDTQKDWFLAKATFNHTYPGPGPYTAADDSCCRLIPLQHVNNPNDRWRVEAIVDFNKTSGNPTSLLPAIVDCPQNGMCQFSVTAVDPDGQPLRWRLATTSEWSATYQPGPPHAPNAASVDPNTGIYTWNTSGATLKTPEDTFYSTQVVIEDLTSTGGVASKSAIDFLIRLVPTVTNNPPVFDVPPSPLSGTVYTVNVGQTLSFPIQASDPDSGDTVTLAAIGSPSGASFPIPPSANPVSSTFSWTPTVADVGSYVVAFTATDNQGVSAPAHSIGINVIPIPNQPPTANANGSYVGNEGSPITFDASASTDPDGDPLTYRWDFDNDGTWDTGWSNSPTATNTWGDDYSGTVKVEVSDGTLTDTATATVTVNNVAPTVDAGSKQTVLAGDTVSFSGSFTDPGWLDTHTIEWDFGDGNTETGTLTPTDIYYDTGVYTVTLKVTDDDGGIGEDTMTVTVNPIPATVNMTLSLECCRQGMGRTHHGNWITAYIELPEGYNVSLIDINTVELTYNGTGIPAVNDTKYGFVTEPESYITDNDEDGILERMVKFDRSAVIDQVKAQNLTLPADVELTVTGKVFYNGGDADFEGSDTIEVIEKGMM